jgi:NAD(P)-dependent dehydrogenase (short-subunit alcohol dehydrogenase family)
MKPRLDDKVAVITGGASGIGRATAMAFAREGATVVVSDVDLAGGDETVSQILAARGKASFVRCDVSSAKDVGDLFGSIRANFGRLDIAFNNAGIELPMTPITDVSEEGWNRLLAVNLTGVFLCIKYEVAAMLERSTGGSIVNNASILGMVGLAGASAYAAAKHGILGLTRTVALECATKGIRVNAVCPGFVDTPMLNRAGITAQPELLARVTNLEPVKRLARPEEIAAAVIWLCSDESSFVTGHPLLVDGGYTAQ